MSAEFADHSASEDANTIGFAQVGESMRDEQDGCIPGECSKLLENLGFCLRVNGGGWFVHNHNPCVAVERPGECKPLKSSLRRIDTIIKFTSYHLIISIVPLFNKAVGPTSSGGIANPREIDGSRSISSSEGNDLLGGKVIARIILKERAKHGMPLGKGDLPQVAAVDEDSPFSGVVDAAEQLHERGLARAVYANQRDAFTRIDGQRDIPENQAFCSRVCEGHVVEDDRWRHAPVDDAGIFRARKQRFSVKDTEKIGGEQAAFVLFCGTEKETRENALKGGDGTEDEGHRPYRHLALQDLKDQASDGCTEGETRDRARHQLPDEFPTFDSALLIIELTEQVGHKLVKVLDVLEKVEFGERSRIIEMATKIEEAPASLGIRLVDAPYTSSISGFCGEFRERAEENERKQSPIRGKND